MPERKQPVSTGHRLTEHGRVIETPILGVNLANLTGFPDLIVPADYTGVGLPVALSFSGAAFSETRLLALGYSFEQATHARRLPVHTPKLAGEIVTVP